MALTADQLALAANLLTRLWVDTDCAKEATAAVKAMDSERHRILHGPFTLAEAVASGRPFRRKGNRMWLRVREHCYGGIFWESSTDDGRIWEMDIIGDGEHEFELEQFTPQAITSVSYELMPEGGE